MSTPPSGPDTEPAPSDRYVIRTTLGQGGSSTVYLTEDRVLGRLVAIKVLRPDRHNQPQVVRRFLIEARIAGQLQHPGVPPVHDLGTLPDGRPFLAMKVVRGKTLDERLKARPDPSTDLPWFLQVFEQVAQTVAFAHSRRVINRDLKPANVMVGAFGEVQVIDWGLAKVLPSATANPDDPARPEETSSLITPADDPASETTDGAVIGTPAYMSPEQARGETRRVDERTDVFALGGILCAVLTGKPPYTGANTVTVLRRAETADLSECLQRLDACTADAELIALGKRCLSPDPADRPVDAEAVAVAVAAYRVGVDKRLRAAELERAAAQARAAEQRKRRRVQLALVAACGVIAVGAVAGLWAWDRQMAATARKEAEAIADRAKLDAERVRLDGEQKATAAHAAAFRGFQTEQVRRQVPELLKLSADLRRQYKFRAARDAIAQARQLLAGGLADDLRPGVEQAEKDLDFVIDLDEIQTTRSVLQRTGPGKGYFWHADAIKDYRKAFAARGLDPDAADPAALVSRVSGSAIRAELIAGLDDWAAVEPDSRRRDRLLGITRRAADPSAWADRFRDPAVWASKAKLAALAADADPLVVTPAAVFTLATLMALNGLDPGPLLSAAHLVHPTDFLIAHALAQWHRVNGDLAAAIAHYRAARALRPDHPATLGNLSYSLKQSGDLVGAEACYQEAIRLNPASATMHNNLGQLLTAKGDRKGAEACFRKAIELDPGDPIPHNNLGAILENRKDPAGAEACYREAIRLDPGYVDARSNLGVLLARGGDLAGGERELRAAVKLAPTDQIAVFNLGGVLALKGDVDGSIECLRTLLELNPEHPSAVKLLPGFRKLRDRRNAVAADLFGVSVPRWEPDP